MMIGHEVAEILSLSLVFNMQADNYQNIIDQKK